MKTLDVRNASKSLADYTAELDSESIVITSNEKPVAALISLRGLDRESVALSLSPDFAKIIRVARSEARRGNVFSGRGQKRPGRGNCFYQIKDSCRARPQTLSCRISQLLWVERFRPPFAMFLKRFMSKTCQLVRRTSESFPPSVF